MKPPVLSNDELGRWESKLKGEHFLSGREYCYRLLDFKRIAQAQRDADVEWYKKQGEIVIVGDAIGFTEVVEQAKQETAREIFGVYDEYIKLLGEEIDSLLPLAYVHGWRCEDKDIRAGEKCRTNIQSLKSQYLPKEEK